MRETNRMIRCALTVTALVVGLAVGVVPAAGATPHATPITPAGAAPVANGTVLPGAGAAVLPGTGAAGFPAAGAVVLPGTGAAAEDDDVADVPAYDDPAYADGPFAVPAAPRKTGPVTPPAAPRAADPAGPGGPTGTGTDADGPGADGPGADGPGAGDGDDWGAPDPGTFPEDGTDEGIGTGNDTGNGTGNGDRALPTVNALGVRIFRGLGFEACTAPSLATMEAWREASPYGAVGIYIGGRARSCAQPRLTPSWVRSVTRMGWNLLPIWVGSQSPCVNGEHQQQFPISAGRAEAQGESEGAQAVRAASALGILRRSPVYVDIEAYGVNSSRCTEPVLDFTQGWDRALRARGYLPGFYSSSDSGIAQLERAREAGRPDLPDLMWFARWNGTSRLYGEPVLPDGVWQPHRRIHQFVGDTQETYGGYALAIDRDVLDAPVAVVG